MSGGKAIGSWTATPTTADVRDRPRANRYASGVPTTAITAVAIVAVSTETHSAEPAPGLDNRLVVASRPRKSPIGLSRYSASRPPSHGSGVSHHDLGWPTRADVGQLTPRRTPLDLLRTTALNAARTAQRNGLRSPRAG
jgi:hypothetical protein